MQPISHYFGTPVYDYRDVPDGIITKPGIYANVSPDVYHRKADLFGAGVPHVSSGILRKLESASPLHVWDESPLNPKSSLYPDPDADEEEEEKVKAENKAFVFGRAAHHLFASEDGFHELFAVQPKTYINTSGKTPEDKPWNNNATVCKEWNKRQALAGKSVLKASDIKDIQGMATRLAECPFVQAGGLSGLIEVSIFFYRDVPVMKEDGSRGVVRVWIKVRPDALPLHDATVTDYKTAASCDAQSARRAITDDGYHQQMALIGDAIEAVVGVKITTFVLLFQEKTRPYAWNTKPLIPDAVWNGRNQNWRALMTFAQCWHGQKWPTYSDDDQPADINKYLADRLDREAKGGQLSQPDPLPNFHKA